jgi:hypothetical protein
MLETYSSSFLWSFMKIWNVDESQYAASGLLADTQGFPVSDTQAIRSKTEDAPMLFWTSYPRTFNFMASERQLAFAFKASSTILYT